MSRFLVLILGALLVLGACSGQQPTPDTTSTTAPVASPTPAETGTPADVSLEDGEKGFKQYCSACHGPEAKGLPNLGKDLTVSPFVDEASSDEIVAMVKQGRPSGHPENTTGVDMPPKGGNPALQDDQIVAIVAWLKSIHQ